MITVKVQTVGGRKFVCVLGSILVVLLLAFPLFSQTISSKNANLLNGRQNPLQPPQIQAVR